MGKYRVQENESLRQIARRHGMRVSQLLKLNPNLADNPNVSVGMTIRLGEGVKPLASPGKPQKRDPRSDPFDGDGGSTPPVRRPGVAWQDPEFVAFMAQFGLDRDRIIADRRDAVSRFRDQYRRNIPLWEQQRQEGRTDIRNDYSGRGMYFSGGRQRDITDLISKVDQQQEFARQQKNDNIFDARKKAKRGLTDLRIEREKERIAARERQAQLDLEIATGQA